MKEKVSFVVMFMVSLSVLGQACDTDACEAPTKHYFEIGCNPIYEFGHDCPVRFDCPSLADRDNQKCYFNGNIYEPGSTLSKFEERMSPCYGGCICAKFEDLTSFVCAAISCPDSMIREDECIYQYSPFECCPTGKICGDQKDELNECYLDGQRYREGENMYPREEPCYKCSCQKGFDNSTVVGNANCYEIGCGIELHYVEQLLKGCVPVYFGTRGCCPIAWRCPNENDKVIKEGQLEGDGDLKMQCKFGNLTLNVGDLVSPNSLCVSCKCAIPPMVHCVQNKYLC